MAVRLNKALKELNVGINTVADYLQKKGLALQDASPIAKISDEQYALLLKEFGDANKKCIEEPKKRNLYIVRNINVDNKKQLVDEQYEEEFEEFRYHEEFDDYDEVPDCPDKEDLPYTRGSLACPYCRRVGDTYADGTAYCSFCKTWYCYA